MLEAKIMLLSINDCIDCMYSTKIKKMNFKNLKNKAKHILKMR